MSCTAGLVQILQNRVYNMMLFIALYSQPYYWQGEKFFLIYSFYFTKLVAKDTHTHIYIHYTYRYTKYKYGGVNYDCMTWQIYYFIN